jgi:ADP-heptose:LPS heptosyltransferase
VSFNPHNILVIDFGQLGDVVLSLPALGAIRNRFPTARITVAVGIPAAPIIEMAGCADEVLPVDRVALRDGPKLLSIARIARLMRDVRRAGYDFVIDLHSLSETNLLGFLSGAQMRLFARRPGRSLDFLANFYPPPPVEDHRKHAVDRYLDVIKPLDVGPVSRVPRLKTRPEDDQKIEKMLAKEKAAAGVPLVGLYPGAGHPSRRWPLARFAELAERLERNDGVRILLFTGPEERMMVRELRAAFPRSTIIFDQLSIPELAAALARLAVFVSNNTGPMHIAAAVGTPVVTLLGRPTPDSFTPIGDRHRVVCSATMTDLSVDDAYAAARATLAASRTATLFAG